MVDEPSECLYSNRICDCRISGCRNEKQTGHVHPNALRTLAEVPPIPDNESVNDVRSSAEYQEALSFLFDRINFERFKKMPYSKRDLNIHRMQRLLELLGNPHESLRIIHIAGTKGKGSTTAFLSSAFVAAGIRCGSYTSPHLQHIEERFCIDGQPCDPKALVELVEVVRPAVAEMDLGDHTEQPTYFEICTAIAFMLFVREEVSVAILEVGLGGRLDSTNVCTPLVSVITSISFDHMKQLGNTLREIATEKAGIIKPGIPVVSGATNEEAQQAIAEVAERNASMLYEINRDFSCEYQSANTNSLGVAHFRPLSSSSPGIASDSLEDVELGLLGEHQARNAAVAWSTLQLLPPELKPNDSAIRNGFKQTRCEARIEVVAHAPEVIMDSSHNVASVEALVEVMQTVYASRRRLLVLGATTGKDIKAMLRVLLPNFDVLVCTQYENNPRAVSAESLAKLAEELMRESSATPELLCVADKREAWKQAKTMATSDDVICVTGSFFIAAEVKELALRNL